MRASEVPGETTPTLYCAVTKVSRIFYVAAVWTTRCNMTSMSLCDPPSFPLGPWGPVQCCKLGLLGPLAPIPIESVAFKYYKGLTVTEVESVCSV